MVGFRTNFGQLLWSILDKKEFGQPFNLTRKNCRIIRQIPMVMLFWGKILLIFFAGKNREMVDKESMAGDGLWQNCNNTDGWVQDYREDEGSTLYLLRRSNEIRFLWMLHDRFDRWGLGIASSSSAANRENPGRRWRSPPLIPRNTKDYLPYNTQSKIPRIFVFEWRSKILLTKCIEFETRREDGIAFERRKIENGFSGHFGSMKPPKVSPSALPLQIEFKYSRKAIEM